MEIPGYLHPQVAQLLSIETENALSKSYWVVILGLKPIIDGDQYCFLWGEDLHSGVCAFGETPLKAMQNFDIEMHNALQKRNVLSKNKCSDGTKQPEGGCFGCEEGDLCA